MKETLNKKNEVLEFSSHLFWDVDVNSMLLDKNKKWLIERVLEYGFISDWILLQSKFGIEEIVNVAVTLRSLSNKTVSFLSTLSEIPKEKFRCNSKDKLLMEL